MKEMFKVHFTTQQIKPDPLPEWAEKFSKVLKKWVKDDHLSFNVIEEYKHVVVRNSKASVEARYDDGSIVLKHQDKSYTVPENQLQTKLKELLV